jgi:hypothetical protein
LARRSRTKAASRASAVGGRGGRDVMAPETTRVSSRRRGSVGGVPELDALRHGNANLIRGKRLDRAQTFARARAARRSRPSEARDRRNRRSGAVGWARPRRRARVPVWRARKPARRARARSRCDRDSFPDSSWSNHRAAFFARSALSAAQIHGPEHPTLLAGRPVRCPVNTPKTAFDETSWSRASRPAGSAVSLPE